MKKKLIYALFASVLVLSACGKKDDDKKSSDKESDEKTTTETKGTDGYEKMVDLANKNPDSILAELFNTATTGGSVNLADTVKTFTSAKATMSFVVKGFKLPEDALSQAQIESNVKSLDIGAEIESSTDADGDMNVKMSVSDSKSLDQLIGDVMNSTSGKQLVAFMPALEDLSVSKINMEALSNEEASYAYAKSDLIDMLIPEAAGKWVQVEQSSVDSVVNQDFDFSLSDMTDELSGTKATDYLNFVYVGSEKVDGVQTDHYVVNLDVEKAKEAGDLDLAELTADEIKTIKNGLVVKVDLWVTESFEMMKAKVQFTMKVTQDLIDVMNKVSPPEAGEEDFPAELIGSTIELSMSVESDKDLSIDMPSEGDYVTQEEFMAMVQESPLGLLLGAGTAS